LKSEIKPDVLLLDIGLPDDNGIDLCEKIKQQYPEIKILMLTTYSEQTIVLRALDNGASGYVLKNAMSEEIIEGIKTVAAGKQFLCDEVDILLKKDKEIRPVKLSRREQEMLRLIIAGYSTPEIAARMFLAYDTIKSYRKKLMLKLDVHNTSQLLKIAAEQKLV
jgi:DNA-binding NarL/FixJ family response regulator